MKYLFFTLVFLSFNFGYAQLTNDQIKEKLIDYLENKDDEHQLYTVTNIIMLPSDKQVVKEYYNGETVISSDAKIVQVEYENYNDKRIVYEARIGVMYNSKTGDYYISHDEANYYKFGTWKLYDSYDELYEVQTYNEQGLLIETKGYIEGELFTVEKFKGNGFEEEPFETYYYEDGVLDYKSTPTADIGLNTDGSVNYTIKKENGQRQGAFETYFTDTKTVRTKGVYNNGDLEGLYESFYEDGTKSTVENYKSGRQNGLYQSYLENGVLEEEGNYKNGERDGQWKISFETSDYFEYPYFTEDLELEEILQLEPYFFKTGIYRDGEETDAPIKIFYITGEKLLDYRGTKLSYYYRNGQVCLEGKISREGEPKGGWSFYDESGNLVKKLQVDE